MNSEQIRSCKALWLAVLAQAVLDATGPILKEDNAEFYHRTARRWVLSNCNDYRLVCFFAGVEADYLRRIIGAK